MERKARLWDLCMSKNIFESFKQSEINEIQKLFENIVNENEYIKDIDILELIKNKISQKNNLNYNDLIPQPKQQTIDFRDNVEEEPIENMDALIEQKTKERNLFQDVSSNIILEYTNPLNIVSVQNQPNVNQSNVNQPNVNQPNVNKQNVQLNKILKKIEKQDKILEQIIFSQIKIMEFLQKK
jgi:hypothetical protein|tara:strand:- start:1246 stop:1794 length:549 start_codon:yes stop_codon:yes gene_type:complete